MRLRRTETIAESASLELDGQATLGPRDLSPEGEDRAGRLHRPIALAPLASGVALAVRLDDDPDQALDDEEELGEDYYDDDDEPEGADEGRRQSAVLLVLGRELVVEKGPYLLPPPGESPVHWVHLATAGDAVAALCSAGPSERVALAVLGEAGEGVRGISGAPGWVRSAAAAGPAFIWIDGAGAPGGRILEPRGTTTAAVAGLGLDLGGLPSAARVEAFAAVGDGYLAVFGVDAPGEPPRVLALDAELGAREEPVILDSDAALFRLAPLGSDRCVLFEVDAQAGAERAGRARATVIAAATGRPLGPARAIEPPVDTLAFPAAAARGRERGIVVFGSVELTTPGEAERRRALLATAFDGEGRRVGRTVEVGADPERDWGEPIGAIVPGWAPRFCLAAPLDRGHVDVRVVRSIDAEAGELEPEFFEVDAAPVVAVSDEGSSGPPSVASPASWGEARAVAGAGLDDAPAYSTTHRPRPGDWLRHPSFGAGLVLEVKGERQALVLFEDGERLLACGR